MRKRSKIWLSRFLAVLMLLTSVNYSALTVRADEADGQQNIEGEWNQTENNQDIGLSVADWFEYEEPNWVNPVGFGVNWETGDYSQFFESGSWRHVDENISLAFRLTTTAEDGSVQYQSVHLSDLSLYINRWDGEASQYRMDKVSSEEMWSYAECVNQGLKYREKVEDPTGAYDWKYSEEVYSVWKFSFKEPYDYVFVYDPDGDGAYMQDASCCFTLYTLKPRVSFYHGNSISADEWYPDWSSFKLSSDTRTFYALADDYGFEYADDPIILQKHDPATDEFYDVVPAEGETMEDYFTIEPWAFAGEHAEKVVGYRIHLTDKAQWHRMIIQEKIQNDDGSFKVETARVIGIDNLIKEVNEEYNTIASKRLGEGYVYEYFYGDDEWLYTHANKYCDSIDDKNLIPTDFKLGYAAWNLKTWELEYHDVVLGDNDAVEDHFMVMHRHHVDRTEIENYTYHTFILNGEYDWEAYYYEMARPDQARLEKGDEDGEYRFYAYERGDYAIVRKEFPDQYDAYIAEDGSIDISRMECVNIGAYNEINFNMDYDTCFEWDWKNLGADEKNNVFYLNAEPDNRLTENGCLQKVEFYVHCWENGQEVVYDSSNAYGGIIRVEKVEKSEADELYRITVLSAKEMDLHYVGYYEDSHFDEEGTHAVWAAEDNHWIGWNGKRLNATWQVFHGENDEAVLIVREEKLDDCNPFYTSRRPGEEQYFGLWYGTHDGEKVAYDAEAFVAEDVTLYDENGEDVTEEMLQYLGIREYTDDCGNKVEVGCFSLVKFEVPAVYSVKYTVDNSVFELTLFMNDNIVALDEETFPDECFREYLSEHYDTDHDGKLSYDEMDAVTMIEFQEGGEVHSLEGIQHFKNLEYLYAEGQLLTELNLWENEKLTTLNVQGNQLTELYLHNNKQLRNYTEKYKDTLSNGYTGLNAQSIYRETIMGDIDDTKYTAVYVSFPLHELYDWKALDIRSSKEHFMGSQLMIHAPESLLKDNVKIISTSWGSASRMDGFDYYGHGRCFDQEVDFVPNEMYFREETPAALFAYVMYVVEGEYTSEEVASKLLRKDCPTENYFQWINADSSVYDELMQDYEVLPNSKVSMASAADVKCVNSKQFQYYTIDFGQFVNSSGDIRAYYEANTQLNKETIEGKATLLPIQISMNDATGVVFNDYNLTASYYVDTFLTDECFAYISPELNWLQVAVDFNYVTDAKKMDALPESLEGEFKSLEDFEQSIADAFDAQKEEDDFECAESYTYDADLWKFSSDSDESWTKVEGEEFPKEGVEVFVPYPVGINDASNIRVAHMFIEDVNGYKAGDIEYPEITGSTASGVYFTVHGFSPIVVMTDVKVDEPMIDGVSVSLAEDVALNFYFGAGSTGDGKQVVDHVYLTGPTGRYLFFMNELEHEAENDLYKATYHVPLKNLGDIISISLRDKNDNIITTQCSDASTGNYTYSVREYLNTVMENGDGDPETDDTALKHLAAAIDTYGLTAQKYFNYNAPAETVKLPAADFSDYQAVQSGKLPTDLSFVGASLTLLDITAIGFYFEGDKDKYEVRVDGKEVEIFDVEDGMFKVYADDIYAVDLDQTHTVSVSGDGAKWEFSYSPFAYAKDAQKKGGDDALLMNAMYNYYDAALSYLVAITR